MSVAQLSRLLPLPEQDLQQVVDYAATLSKQDAANHFNDLLGETPQSVEFISSFNSRRQDPPSSPSPPPASQPDLSSGVPKSTRKPPKKKVPLHTPAPRQIQDTYAGQGTAYVKRENDDYMPKKANAAKNNTLALQPKPEAVQAPIPRAPPSAAGTLISDSLKSKSTPTSRHTSRTSSPAPKTKVSITGGNAMHSASTVLSELDAAIRSLEISTNSTLLDNEKRKCNCVATRHPLLTAAPNCLNCGKVICVKEGLGPCTFCGTPLLTAVEVQGMIRELREERGKEKMAMDASAHRRAEVSTKPRPFTQARDADYMTPAEQKAKEHRDRLLGFQAQNAKRTTVRDEAADFDTSMATGGPGSMWASPAERARQLKTQQKVLAEQEWNAKPEYEKRRQVVSIDLVKGKVVKRMGTVEPPESKPAESEDEEVDDGALNELSENRTSGGTFSQNPLLGGLIKPIYHQGKGKEVEEQAGERKKTWRRVQDDLDDNEDIILDGGVYGGNMSERRLGQEEHANG